MRHEKALEAAWNALPNGVRAGMIETDLVHAIAAFLRRLGDSLLADSDSVVADDNYAYRLKETADELEDKS